MAPRDFFFYLCIGLDQKQRQFSRGATSVVVVVVVAVVEWHRPIVVVSF
jgi:hypothetical protein